MAKRLFSLQGFTIITSIINSAIITITITITIIVIIFIVLYVISCRLLGNPFLSKATSSKVMLKTPGMP